MFFGAGCRGLFYLLAWVRTFLRQEPPEVFFWCRLPGSFIFISLGSPEVFFGAGCRGLFLFTCLGSYLFTTSSFSTTYVPMLRIPEVPTMCRSVWHMHLSCQTVPELPGHARLAIAGVRTGFRIPGLLGSGACASSNHHGHQAMFKSSRRFY